jgi:porin
MLPAGMVRLSALAALLLIPACLHAEDDGGLFKTIGLAPSWLEDRGISLGGNYTAEILGNVRGGIHTGAAFNGLLHFGLEIEAEKAVGWQGATLHAEVIHPHGNSLTERYVGDFGVVSNLDSYDSLRLYEAWLEQNFFDDRFSLRVGFLAADTEFAVVDAAGLFVSSDFGVPAAQSANFPMSCYPFSTLGVRLRIEPAPGWSVMFAAYDGNPAPGVLSDPTPGAAASNEFNHWNTHFALRQDEGAMLFAEVGWHVEGEDTKDAPAPLAMSIKLGGGYHTDRFTDLDHPDERGKSGNFNLYAIVERELWREPGTKGDGLTAFARGVFAPENRNFLRHSAEAGLVYRGLAQSDARDSLGLAVAWLGVSREARDEFTVELTYQHAITDWWSVQPDMQWIINPGGNSDNALVIGLRTTVTF